MSTEYCDRGWLGDAGVSGITRCAGKRWGMKLLLSGAMVTLSGEDGERIGEMEAHSLG